MALQPVYGQQERGSSGWKIVVVEGANAKNVTQEIPLQTAHCSGRSRK